MDLELTDEERRLLAAHERSEGRTGCWVGSIFGSFGLALLIVGWQVFSWLRNGAWPLLPVEVALRWFSIPRPEISWVGAQRIVDWLLACPLSGVLVWSAMAAVFIFTRDDHKPVPEALRTARMKQARARTNGPAGAEPNNGD